MTFAETGFGQMRTGVKTLEDVRKLVLF